MKAMITGYQWGVGGLYIGPYEFPNNLDQEAVHLPPQTTLIAPPMNLPVDQEAAWDGEQWIVRNITMDWLIPQQPAPVEQ